MFCLISKLLSPHKNILFCQLHFFLLKKISNIFFFEVSLLNLLKWKENFIQDIAIIHSIAHYPLKCIVLRYKQLGEVNLTADSGCFGNSLLLILALVRCFSCETLNFIIEKDKRLSETLFVFLPHLLFLIDMDRNTCKI